MTKIPIKQPQTVKNAFQSILRTDYVSLENIDELENLEKYYIDNYNNIGNLLQKQDNFIFGRRGTGKTALLYRGYFECLKTISPKIEKPSDYFGDEAVLPIYIDLKTCNELFDPTKDQELIEIHFIRQIITSLKEQLDLMFDEKTLLVFRKENPALEDLENISSLLITGLTIKKSRHSKVTDKTKKHDNASLETKFSLTTQSVGGSIFQSEEKEHTTQSTELKGLNIQEFLRYISEIRKKAKIDSIFLFIDEFSDLNTESQLKFSHLLKNFLGSKNNIYFKIGTITDRYTFGDKIRIGRDLFPIPLDINEYVERFGGAIPAVKEMPKFVERLITKRLEIFCPNLKYADIFKIQDEVLYHKIALESLGVPRTIGLILQNAWNHCNNIDKIEKKIGSNELNFGITSTRRTYYQQFEGAVKGKIIPAHYMGIWNDLISKAINERIKFSDRPSSHFMISPNRKHYLNVLCENFLVHFLEENRGSKVGRKFNLYCLDYDVCVEYNIKFAEDKDELSSGRFIYDDILSRYDPYFTKERIRSYKCPKCQKIFEETELLPSKVKRCFDDDSVLEEIIHKDSPTLNEGSSEVETKILGMIFSLSEKDAMTAREIADAVGCNVQKVAIWGTIVLAKKNIIKIKKEGSINLYYSSMTPSDSK